MRNETRPEREERVRQAADDGTPFPRALAAAGILPGIKVDTGAKPLAGFPGETVTEGLDGLRDRIDEYHELGARFAKWRAVIKIDSGLPTRGCIVANRMPSRAMPRSARRRASSRSSSPRC